MHDTRIGRFFAVDPLTAKYPHYTPYSFSGNRVLDAIELEGLEEHLLKNGSKIYGPLSGDAIAKENDKLILRDRDIVSEDKIRFDKEFKNNHYQSFIEGQARMPSEIQYVINNPSFQGELKGPANTTMNPIFGDPGQQKFFDANIRAGMELATTGAIGRGIAGIKSAVYWQVGSSFIQGSLLNGAVQLGQQEGNFSKIDYTAVASAGLVGVFFNKSPLAVSLGFGGADALFDWSPSGGLNSLFSEGLSYKPILNVGVDFAFGSVANFAGGHATGEFKSLSVPSIAIEGLNDLYFLNPNFNINNKILK